MHIKILPYKPVSVGALALARAMPNARKIRLPTRRQPAMTYVPRRTHIVINWGNTMDVAYDIDGKVYWMLNPPSLVETAINKLEFFKACAKAKVPTPEFCTDKNTARKWLGDGYIVVARRYLKGRSGRGIHLIHTPKDIIDAPLYTRYQPKKREYRVHVIDGKIVDIQQKKKAAAVPKDEVNFQVRSHENGWVYCRQDVAAPKQVKDAAIKAVDALELDFGAADIGYTENSRKAVCYEVNTAPGLEGTTLETYAKHLGAYIKNETK